MVPLELASWSQTVPLVGLMGPEVGTSSGEVPTTGGSGEVPTTGGGVGTSTGAGETGRAETGTAGTAGTDGESGEGGCGCRGGGGGGGLSWAPVVVLLWRRRGRGSAG